MPSMIIRDTTPRGHDVTAAIASYLHERLVSIANSRDVTATHTPEGGRNHTFGRWNYHLCWVCAMDHLSCPEPATPSAVTNQVGDLISSIQVDDVRVKDIIAESGPHVQVGDVRAVAGGGVATIACEIEINCGTDGVTTATPLHVAASNSDQCGACATTANFSAASFVRDHTINDRT